MPAWAITRSKGTLSRSEAVFVTQLLANRWYHCDPESCRR
jgi:hypothetical protein